MIINNMIRTEFPMRVHFHIGPHKTATTYMQARLRANWEQLADRGICFVDLWRGGKVGAAYRAALRAGLDGGRARRGRLREAEDLLLNLTQQGVAQAGWARSEERRVGKEWRAVRAQRRRE